MDTNDRTGTKDVDMQNILNKFENAKIVDENQDANVEVDVQRKIQQLQVEIRNKLSSAETATKWLQSYPVTEEHLKKYFQGYEQEMKELPAIIRDDKREVRFTVIECIARACLMAQILVNKKNPDKFRVDVNKLIQIAREFIGLGETRGYFHKDYSDGFRYVVKCLEIDSLDLQNVEIEELNPMLDFIDHEFANLSTKAYVGVLALKQYINGNLCRATYDWQIRILKQMINKDPENLEWHLCHHLVLRFQRDFVNVHGKPSEEEIQAVLRAKNCPGGDGNPVVLLASIELLASVVRWAWDQLIDFGGFQFGNKFFRTLEGVVDFIGEQAQEIQSMDPTSVRSCVGLAKIFSTKLPFHFRDYLFAQMCLERALLFHPHCSKVHHRMGVLQISMRQKEKACKYLKEAYERDRRNIFALHDLLHVLMAHPSANFDEINMLFESFDSSYWRQTDPHRYAILLFDHALFHLSNGKKAEATEKFLEAFQLDENVINLSDKKDVEKRAGKFNWRGDMSSRNILQSVCSALQQTARNSNDENKRDNILKMHQKIEEEQCLLNERRQLGKNRKLYNLSWRNSTVEEESLKLSDREGTSRGGSSTDFDRWRSSPARIFVRGGTPSFSALEDCNSERSSWRRTGKNLPPPKRSMIDIGANVRSGRSPPNCQDEVRENSSTSRNGRGHFQTDSDSANWRSNPARESSGPGRLTGEASSNVNIQIDRLTSSSQSFDIPKQKFRVD